MEKKDRIKKISPLSCPFSAAGNTVSGARTGGNSPRGMESVFDAEEIDDFVSEPSSIFNRYARLWTFSFNS